MFCLFKLCQELTKSSLTIYNFYSLPYYLMGKFLISLFNDTFKALYPHVGLSKIYVNKVLKLLYLHAWKQK